jgi:hypothetical protein
MMGQIVDVHFLKQTVAGEETDIPVGYFVSSSCPFPIANEENPHKLFESSVDPQGHRPHDFLTSPLDLEICAASPSSDFLMSLHLTLLSIKTSENLQTRSTDLLLQVTTSIGDLILC